ncbi:hypothetical protein Tco_0842009, partial [Tanacetum coccineum]
DTKSFIAGPISAYASFPIPYMLYVVSLIAYYVNVMDVPLLLDHELDFFAAEPVPGLAEAPDNQNRWIE